MSRKPQHCPSFFKVLINDFANKLPIPPAFVNELKGKFPGTTVLKTECGGSWEVEIKVVGQKYCFVNGWLEFVNFHKLEEYDFLVFWLIHDSIFQVTIYDPSCCEKKLHPPLHTRVCDTKIEPIEFDPFEKRNPSSHTDRLKKPRYNIKNLETDMEIEKDDDEPKAHPSPKTDYPCFVSALKKTSKKNLFLPVHFVRETGLARKRGTVLRDPKGRAWPAVIKIWTKNRVHLTHGWTDLQKANKLREGDTCLFKYIRNEGNLIQVQVLKKSADQNKRGRGRGRPPLSSYRLP